MIMIQAARLRDAETLGNCLVPKAGALPARNEQSSRRPLTPWLPLQQYEWHAGAPERSVFQIR